MISAQQLYKQHDHLLELAARMEHIVARSVPTPNEARDCLSELTRRLREHLAHEGSIYPLLTGCHTPYAAQVGRRFSNEITGLSKHWRDYLARWPRSQMSASWPRFQEETKVAMRRLQHRIERENQFLLPAALKVAAITLRHQATAQ